MAYSNKIMCNNVRLSDGAPQSKRDNNENSGQSIAGFARAQKMQSLSVTGRAFAFVLADLRDLRN